MIRWQNEGKKKEWKKLTRLFLRKSWNWKRRSRRIWKASSKAEKGDGKSDRQIKDRFGEGEKGE